MQAQAVIDVAGELLPMWASEKERLDAIDKWYRGKNDLPFQPRRSTKEFKRLRERAVTPWLKLIVTSVSQSMYVDGYRRSDKPEDLAPWAAWQANGMDARQIQIHRGALALGASYTTILPGDIGPVIRGVSARKMLAVYGDPAEDEWPMYGLRVERSGGALAVRLYDEENVYYLSVDKVGDVPTFIQSSTHGMGFTPIVRYCNELDLDGRTDSDIEPLIPLVSRIDQTTFDRLIVQRFASWKVRTVSGMTEPDNDEERAAKKMLLEVGDLLVSEDADTKFGTLDETPLDGFIKAHDSDLHDLAAVSQTPPYWLLGLAPNLSAEALVAAAGALDAKRDERKTSFGESHEQTLRAAAVAAGDEEGAMDMSAQVIWRDSGSRSLAQAADALGKLATMLQVPVEKLWEQIPGWTLTDVEQAKDMRAADPLHELADTFKRQSQPTQV